MASSPPVLPAFNLPTRTTAFTRRMEYMYPQSGEYVPYPHTDYWKVGQDAYKLDKKQLRCRLERYGFEGKPTATKAELMQMDNRAQRGLCCYEKCSRDELREFAIARHLLADEGRNPTAAKLVKMLIQADEDRTFAGFSDLPPELRAEIYTHHLESFCNLSAPVLPPITRVSRLVRKEALPLFYTKCRFNIPCMLTRRRIHAMPWLDRWLENTPTEHLRSMERLHLHMGILDDRKINFWNSKGYHWHVHLDGETAVEWKGRQGGEGADYETADARLRQLVAGMAKKPQGRRLELADVRWMMTEILLVPSPASPSSVSP